MEITLCVKTLDPSAERSSDPSERLVNLPKRLEGIIGARSGPESRQSALSYDQPRTTILQILKSYARSGSPASRLGRSIGLPMSSEAKAPRPRPTT